MQKCDWLYECVKVLEEGLCSHFKWIALLSKCVCFADQMSHALLSVSVIFEELTLIPVNKSLEC